MKTFVNIVIITCILCGVAFPQQGKSGEDSEAQTPQHQNQKKKRGKQTSRTRSSTAPYGKSVLERKSSAQAADATSAKEHRIDISSSFSYYFNINKNGSIHFSDSTSPTSFTPINMSNMSLSMGLNLYKSVGAYFDLGINNNAVKKAIDWACRIGTEYFDFQSEYNFVSGTVSYREDANMGADKNTQTDLSVYYDQTWITVALLYKSPIYLNDSPSASPLLLGLFYNHAVVPAHIWVYRDMVDDKNKFAILDKSCPVTAFGIRLYQDNVGLKRIPDDLSGGWTTKTPLRFTSDIGVGFAKPNKDVMATAKENGGQFSNDTYLTGYFSLRLAAGLEFFNRFTENQVVHFGFGLDFHIFGYMNPYSDWESRDYWKSSGNWKSFAVGGGLGPIVRVGYAW